MHTVEILQSKFGSKSIIIVVNKLSESELKFLLEEDNLDVISAVIEGMQFANQLNSKNSGLSPME